MSVLCFRRHIQHQIRSPRNKQSLVTSGIATEPDGARPVICLQETINSLWYRKSSLSDHAEDLRLVILGHRHLSSSWRLVSI